MQSLVWTSIQIVLQWTEFLKHNIIISLFQVVLQARSRAEADWENKWRDEKLQFCQMVSHWEKEKETPEAGRDPSLSLSRLQPGQSSTWWKLLLSISWQWARWMQWNVMNIMTRNIILKYSMNIYLLSLEERSSARPLIFPPYVEYRNPSVLAE